MESGQVIYGLTSTYNFNKLTRLKSNDTLKKEDVIKNKVISKIIIDSKNDENTNFQLSFTKGKAYYRYINSLDTDELSLNISKVAAKSKGDFYFDFSNNIVVNKFQYKGEMFNVEDSLENYNWKITKETKKIGDYLCFKAIGEQKLYFSKSDKTFTFPIEAWFTPELPICAGPDGVGGLPGLILELKLKMMTYYAKEINFEEVDDIKMPSSKKVITRYDYNQFKRKLYLERG